MLRKTELKNALEHIREVAHECGLSEEECKELLAEWWGTLICIGAGC